jgi:hypothetical protein
MHVCHVPEKHGKDEKNTRLTLCLAFFATTHDYILHDKEIFIVRFFPAHGKKKR